MADDPSSSTQTNGSARYGGWLSRVRVALGRSESGAPASMSGENGGANSGADHGRTNAAELRLSNTQRFETLRVEDVMVPRADVIAVDIDTPILTVAKLIADCAHSRLPVYRETLDEPLGLVHIRDVVPHLIAAGEADASVAIDPPLLKDILRQVLYVPTSMPAADLLLKMQSRRVHMAIVVDEFGGTDGLVTLEDLVEEIVGDIEDEHDEDEAPLMRKRSAHCWEAEARTPLEEIEAALGTVLVQADDAQDIDTLGGLVFTMVNRVPERGEIITHPDGFDFEVVDADARRIKRVVIRRRDARSAIPAESEAANSGDNAL
jgi:CBS domain containing-hemolysin-like protein